MKIIKLVFLVLVLAFVLMQFVRAGKNNSLVPPENNIGQQIPVPADVDSILKLSCYNCHSNNTVYPWYAEIQPVGWWLAGHIRDGKRGLNFDEFANYPIWRQYRKLEQIKEQIEKGEMPYPPYLWIHRNARLSPEKKSTVISWCLTSRKTMAAKYPTDSLRRPPRPAGAANGRVLPQKS